MTLSLPRTTRHELLQQFDLLYRHFGVPARHEGKLDVVLGDYHEAVGHFPADVVATAVREYLGTHDKFFPSIAALRSLCQAQVRTLKPAERRLSADDPDDNGPPCPTCGEYADWWVLQRADGTLYDRKLTRHLADAPCARFNQLLGRGTLLGRGRPEDYAHLVAPTPAPEPAA